MSAAIKTAETRLAELRSSERARGYYKYSHDEHGYQERSCLKEEVADLRRELRRMDAQWERDTTTRIGDAERDRTLGELREHYAAGRLTLDEFDERSSAALGAAYQADLDPLVKDLPALSQPAAVTPVAVDPAWGSRPPATDTEVHALRMFFARLACAAAGVAAVAALVMFL